MDLYNHGADTVRYGVVAIDDGYEMTITDADDSFEGIFGGR
jgi:hypothetical protein